MSPEEDTIDAIRLALAGMGITESPATAELLPYQKAWVDLDSCGPKAGKLNFGSKPPIMNWAEYQFNLLERMAKSLTDAGWKFIQKEGPRGFYYEGVRHNGGIARVMGEQLPTKEAAFTAALRQADGIQFPFFR